MDSAGLAALITALTGALVSVVAVIRNSKQQATATGVHSDNITILTEQIARLAVQVNQLKEENSALKAEIKLLREQLQK